MEKACFAKHDLDNSQKSEPEAVGVSEAARLAGIGRSTIYVAISSGALASVKIGKRRLVRMQALRDWLASLEAKAA
ncbi:MAG: helix-turn-helix domain-containing protein [Pseudomonadota bacterium]